MSQQIVEYYDHLARNYDQDRFNNSYGQFIDRQEREILNRLILNPEETIVDLACGSGRLLNFATIGIDASHEMILIAQQKFPGKILYESDAEKTPLADNSIDTIIAFHFFMHLDQDKFNSILAESNRVLKKNGRIIFDIPSKKRRDLLKYKMTNWHGAYSLTFREANKIQGFKIKKTFGILLLPIHRFPGIIRPLLSRVDRFLSNSFLKEYSSYLIVELEKNDTF